MKFSFLFWICIHGIPIEPEVTDPDVVTPEVDNAEVGRLNEVDRLKNAIYAPLMALKRTREDRIVFIYILMRITKLKQVFLGDY